MNNLTNKIQLKIDSETIDKTGDDFEILDYYPQLKLVKEASFYNKKYPDEYYFCYNYAFNTIHMDDCEEGFKRLLYEYFPVKKSEAKKGDIVSFHKTELYTRGLKIPNSLNVNHFAIISEVKSGKIKIKSKWGTLGVFEGSISDVPNGYGNTYSIWHKKDIKQILRRQNQILLEIQ